MTDTAIGTAIGQEQRDEAIAEALTAGRSLRAVRKEFGISTAELDGALERLWPIDAVARLRMIKSDLGKLDRLTQVFYEKALAGCIQSGLLAVRIWERKHELLGMNAAAKFEVVTASPQAETQHNKIRRVLWELKHPGQPMPDGWPSPAYNDDDDLPPKQLNDGLPHPKRLNGGNGAAVSSPPADDPDPDDPDPDLDPGPLDSPSKRGIVG